MIKSMTGFGKGESKGRFGRFLVEIRTVNHRYFDVSSRMPNSLSALEDKIKNYTHKYIRRGKVNVSLLHRKSEKAIDSIRLDDEAIARYYKMLTRIKKRFRLKDDIKLSHIFSFPDVIVQEQPERDASAIWPSLEQAIKKAILDCNRMRVKEGRALYKDLRQRIETISGSIDKISRLVPKIVSEYKDKLDSRIKSLLKKRAYDIDDRRLETELAIFAKQSDVSEEITRAKSHLDALRNTLSSTKEAGRRLDFILQELQREINTLGSKTGSVKISRLVVDIKSETEKMREQVQNVE
ncbi:MAG: YicC family protein [Candidatus Omnitrophica bacterium]|nr:YicC family protein [Candidatus Omnitrophota bacterium]